MALQSKNFKKFLTSFVATAVVVSTAVPSIGLAATKGFPDVPANHYAKAAVDALAEKGIMQGVGNGKFGFGQKTTKAEVAKMLVSAAGIKVNPAAKSSFKDVKAGKWYTASIATLEKELPGVINGDGTGNFRPEKTVTRAELAKMVATAYKLKLNGDNHIVFKDVPNNWSKSFIEILASNGIVKGTGFGKFEPNGFVTRQDTAQFFYNAELYKSDHSSEEK